MCNEAFASNALIQYVDVANLDWHLQPIDEVLERLAVSPSQGLSADQIARRIRDGGRNFLSPPPSQICRRVFLYLFGQFGSILFVASILVFVA